MAYLMEKLEEVKEKKRIKMERKAKWNNWLKTQAMFYKKTSTNYKKVSHQGNSDLNFYSGTVLNQTALIVRIKSLFFQSMILISKLWRQI